MDIASLIKEISKPLSKRKVIALAAQAGNAVPELIKLSQIDNTEAAFRAAWILETIVSSSPGIIDEFTAEFINVYLVLRNRSCQRHFTKILMNLTAGYRFGGTLLPASDPLRIVEFTFELMIDPETPVAVKVNCMDILYNFRDVADWIPEELAAQIGFQLRTGSAALQSRGKKVLHKLSRRHGKI